MKKFFLLLSVTLMTIAMSSCLDNNNKNSQTTTLTAIMYNRVINAEQPAFSIDKYQLAIDYYAGTIVVLPKVKVDGKKVTFKTSALPLKKDESNNTYTFATGSLTGDGGQKIENLTGILDLQKGVLFIQFSVDGTMVYATSGLYFAKVNTVTTPLDGAAGEAMTKKNASYEFTIDPTTLKAAVLIHNFNGTTETQIYKDLTAKVTPEGYEITGTNLKPAIYDDTYTAKDFKATIGTQGQALTVNFDCHSLHFAVTGQMFSATK